MQPARVNALTGWRWIADSYRLFRGNPRIWISLVFIFWLILGLSNMIRVVGPLLMTVLMPVFLAGLMLACRTQEQGGELEIAHLFAGFKQNVSQLITLGGINLTATVLIIGLSASFDGGIFLKMVFFGEMPPGMAESSADFALDPSTDMAVLFSAALSLPLMMAYWFSTSLIVFNGVPALQAMKLSLVASLRNVMPFLVYSLALIGLVLGFMMLLGMFMGVLGSVFGQGILMAALLVVILLPLLMMFVTIMIISFYTSYKSVFPESNIENSEINS